MASILDQYEQASSRPSGNRRPQQAMPEPVSRDVLKYKVSTGFINARLEDDTPIFNKQRINFNPPDPITHLVVCNNFLVMAMSSNILLRVDLEHPDQPDEVEIPKALDDRIYRIYLDPTGRHLIVSMLSSENYYLSRNSKKPRPLGKLKGHQISAVGWNRQNTNDTTTGEILLGTTRGLIFETEINASEDSRFFQASLEQYVKQLFNLGKERASQVTGLEFEKMPSTSLTEYRYFILATLPGRLYQFIGSIPTSADPPIFQHIFSRYEDIPERFLELPGNFGYSELCLYFPKFRGMPKSFAWMTGPGIYYGDVDITGAAGQDSITMDTRLMQYPAEDQDANPPPLSMVLTEFHVLILFNDRLKAMCSLNEQLIYDDSIPPERFGKLLGMCKDPLKGTIWAYTSQSVFKYKVIRESRDVWQMYLDKEEFDLAREYCKDNPANMDKVLTKQAEFFFKKENYQRSAEIYAQTQNSFEEVALKFIQLDQKVALKTFLLHKLASLKPQDKTQVTMLVTWLIELYLNQLGVLKEQGQVTSDAYDNQQKEFRKFLSQQRVKECVNYNRSTIYDLIASHGDVEDMVFFAVLMQDFERVISHYLQHENYLGALQILSKQSDLDLYYKFSPILMQNVPKETVTAWIAKGRQVDPKKLIPALVQYDHQKYRTQGNEAIRYLEECILHDTRDQAIHNYLVSLYAKLQPDKLMTYLNAQGQDPETVCYDLKYALRLCSEHDHKRAAVHIYSTMGLYEEAVDLALQVDVDLAKQNASKPEDDEELRKKLWLRIARHVVEEEKDIARAMEFLHECDLLQIEDILPFFPDFVTIDHFKDAICTSLYEYNQHIDTLKEEMEEATESAREIRAEIQAFRNKYAFVKSQDKCSSCRFPLMTRAFYIFPCMHRFHNDCLMTEVLPHLSIGKRLKAEDLQRQVTSQDQSPTTSSSPGAMSGALPGGIVTPDLQRLREELDDIIAAECVFCGDIMIRSIDQPFIDPEEYKDVLKSWL